jgi:phosphoglycolate phosphatase
MNGDGEGFIAISELAPKPNTSDAVNNSRSPPAPSSKPFARIDEGLGASVCAAESVGCITLSCVVCSMNPSGQSNPNLFPFRRTAFDAVLFDLDGTLVDTLDDFVAALQAMLGELEEPWRSHRLQRGEIEPLVGKGSENLVNQALGFVMSTQGAIKKAANVAKDEVLVQQALAIYLRHYRGINGQFARVYDGVRTALQSLQQDGMPMACVTNKPTLYAQELLSHIGLGSCFCTVVGGDAVPRKKPDPMALLEACGRMGVAPTRSLMVGDSSNDAQAARAAGCSVLLVRYGYNHGEPVDQVDADGWCDSLADVFHSQVHPV